MILWILKNINERKTQKKNSPGKPDFPLRKIVAFKNEKSGGKHPYVRRMRTKRVAKMLWSSIIAVSRPIAWRTSEEPPTRPKHFSFYSGRAARRPAAPTRAWRRPILLLWLRAAWLSRLLIVSWSGISDLWSLVIDCWCITDLLSERLLLGWAVHASMAALRALLIADS